MLALGLPNLHLLMLALGLPNEPAILPALFLTLFRMGLFGAAHGWGEGGEFKKAPLPKICHTYRLMMKLGLVIHYLKNIQKIYE